MVGLAAATKALRHHWKISLAVLLAAAVNTSVLAGALIVGDSVRGSLRDMTLDRLGDIDLALVAERFFPCARLPGGGERDRLALFAVPFDLESLQQRTAGLSGDRHDVGPLIELDGPARALGEQAVVAAGIKFQGLQPLLNVVHLSRLEVGNGRIDRPVRHHR